MDEADPEPDPGQKPPLRWPGCTLSLILLAFPGLPWMALFLMGERECDMHIGPPCPLSWGMTKLIAFVIVIALCWVIGWTINMLVNKLRNDR